jgi:hypothetical protein
LLERIENYAPILRLEFADVAMLEELRASRGRRRVHAYALAPPHLGILR